MIEDKHRIILITVILILIIGGVGGVFLKLLPSIKEKQAVDYVNLVYNYNSVKELQDNNKKLLEKTAKELQDKMNVDKPLVLLNRYMDFRDMGVKVIIDSVTVKGRNVWVVFTISNAYIDDTKMLAILTIKGSKVVEFQDYIMEDILQKKAFGLPPHKS